jgi:hypothetical protein
LEWDGGEVPVGGEAIRGKDTERGGVGILKFYADVYKTKRNGERYRITYTTDGITFKHIDSFGEIPAGPGDRLFMDTLPVQHTDGAIELLGRGVEVYYLRRLTLLEKARKELRLPKSARGDIKALMSIEERCFRRVTADFLVMRRMILAHRILSKTHQQLLNKYRALSDAEREVLKPAISSIEKQLVEMARMIAVEAGKRYPAYNVLVEALGVSDSSALEALAEVLLPEWRSWRRIRNFFGLWRRDRKTYFHRSKNARHALERLTISLMGHKIRGDDLKEVLKTIWITLKAQEAGLTAPA